MEAQFCNFCHLYFMFYDTHVVTGTSWSNVGFKARLKCSEKIETRFLNSPH